VGMAVVALHVVVGDAVGETVDSGDTAGAARCWIWVCFGGRKLTRGDFNALMAMETGAEAATLLRGGVPRGLLSLRDARERAAVTMAQFDEREKKGAGEPGSFFLEVKVVEREHGDAA